MNMKKKAVIAGIIVIVVVVLAAVVAGGSNSAKVVTVAQAASGDYDGKRVQVSGTVVDNSFSTDAQGVLTFDIVDAEEDQVTGAADSASDTEAAALAATVHVSYDKGVSATFGNGVSAICTGMIEDGCITCTELVTKCPSKYESSTDALSVAQLLGYGESVLDKPVKVTGYVRTGTLQTAGTSPRLVLVDTLDAADDASQEGLGVEYDGALPDEVEEGSILVVTGSLGADGLLAATDVALAS